jgi:hypothetical protein
MPNIPTEIKSSDLQYAAVFDDNGGDELGDAQRVVGIQRSERGLMWVEIYLSGYMQPELQSRAAYSILNGS